MNKKKIVIFSLIWIVVILFSLEWICASRIIWRISALEPYFVGHNKDSWTHIAFELERIKKNKSTNIKHEFVFLGGSSSLASTVGEKTVSNALSKFKGEEVSFTLLGSSNKSLTDESKIVNALNDFKGTIIIPVEVRRFTRAFKEEFILTDSKRNLINHKFYHLKAPHSIYDIITKSGGNIPLTDRFYLSRTAAMVGQSIVRRINRMFIEKRIFLAIQYDQSLWYNREPVWRGKKASIIERIGKSYKGYQITMDRSFKLFKEVVRIAKKNKNKVLILEMPYNRVFDDSFIDVNKHYKTLMNDFVVNNEVEYLDFSNKGYWQPEDFYDISHLRTTGSEKFTELLINKLAESHL